MMSPMSAEATVVRGYIDWMVQTVECAQQGQDLRQAQEILDTDHYGLERVKIASLSTLRFKAVSTKSRDRSSAW